MLNNVILFIIFVIGGLFLLRTIIHVLKSEFLRRARRRGELGPMILIAFLLIVVFCCALFLVNTHDQCKEKQTIKSLLIKDSDTSHLIYQLQNGQRWTKEVSSGDKAPADGEVVC